VVTEVHEVTPREVRDLPILDAETWLILPRVRLRCPRCGPTVEAIPWLDRYAGMTRRFAESVARLAQVLPIKQVAEHYGLSWDTVKTIDRAALEARLGPVDLTDVRQIAIDEFAIQKGHRYATSIVDPVTTKVLWVTPGTRPGGHPPVLRAARPRGVRPAGGRGDGYERGV
jgi:transposase